VEGLIHVSELANGNVGHPSDVVTRGDELTLRIISINSMRRRIGLSLRQVPPKEELTPELAPDDKVIPAEVPETAEKLVHHTIKHESGGFQNEYRAERQGT
jgi:ribosomal protein S1